MGRISPIVGGIRRLFAGGLLRSMAAHDLLEQVDEQITYTERVSQQITGIFTGIIDKPPSLPKPRRHPVGKQRKTP